MIFLIAVAAAFTFSWYAGNKIGKAYYAEDNKKKAYVLMTMYVIIYIVSLSSYIIYT